MLSDNRIKKILPLWLDTWRNGSRKVTFSREVNDVLRDNGTSSLEIQETISAILVSPHKTKVQQELLTTYALIKKECEMSIAEDLAEREKGAIFLLKSQHGYEDKQTVKVEDGNLASIIRDNSQHIKDE